MLTTIKTTQSFKHPNSEIQPSLSRSLAPSNRHTHGLHHRTQPRTYRITPRLPASPHHHHHPTMPPRPRTPSPKPSKRASKKPFHIPRSALNVPEYRADLVARSPIHLLKRASTAIFTSRKFWIYVCLQICAAWVGYGQAMLCVGILWGMVEGTGNREGGMSSWSVFNEGVVGIEGSTDVGALEREMRGERGRWVR